MNHGIEKELEKRAIKSMYIAAAVLVTGFMYVSSWGSYSMSLPLIKLQQITGTLSPQGYEELAQACMSLGKYDCVREAYMGGFKKSADPIFFAKLGRFEARLGSLQPSINAYGSYFKLGGTDADATIQYAKLLEEANLLDEALKFYEAAIPARPEALPIQATAGIVRVMVKQGKYKEARERIMEFHRSAGNAKGYLNTELAQLNAHFGKKGASL